MNAVPAHRSDDEGGVIDDHTICVGGGYVGLVTAVCLAEMGRTVRVVEADTARLDELRAGRAPLYEPGLDALLRDVIAAGRFEGTDDIRTAVSGAGVIFVAVGTPPNSDGGADLDQVMLALERAGACAADGTVIVIKSTVPPGTAAGLTVPRAPGRLPLAVVACPESLREGNALEDFRRPARVVIGGADQMACQRVAAIFEPLKASLVITDATSAELIKYGANAFLALKISFINEIAHICELAGGDIDDVADGIGLDPRIGRAFLRAGLGFGGSCSRARRHLFLPWSLVLAVEVGARSEPPAAQSICCANSGGARRCRRRAAFCRAGIGLQTTGTDDMRQAASIDVIRQLQRAGCTVTACDPVATAAAAPLLRGTTLTTDAYQSVTGADVVALVTEWPEYQSLDWGRVAELVNRRAIVDGRNCLDPVTLRAAGFTHRGMGRRAS